MDLDAIKSAVESASGRRVTDLQLGAASSRLYSTVRDLVVRYEGEKAEDVRYVLKTAGERAGRQAQLAHEAADVSSGFEGVLVPETIHVEGEQLLLVRRFDGRPLNELCTLSNPLRWFGDLARPLQRAGAWLAHYHRATRTEAAGTPLSDYVRSRADDLARLQPSVRDTLLQRCDAGLQGGYTASHGDFTPWNVLVARDRICVIDFGIKEWVRMSPYWDVVSMTVGLRSQMRFAWRSPGRWFPGLADRLERTFCEAYGLGDHPDVALCTAVRHLSFLAGSGPAAKARWHTAEIERALAI